MSFLRSQYAFRRTIAFSFGLIAALFGTAQATEAPQDPYSLSLEQLLKIQITTGTPLALAKAPAVASVISAADIKAMGALTIDDALVTVPGLYVAMSPLDRLNPNYTFRGIYAGQNAQVMFMLNGHRIYGGLYAAGISKLARMNVNHISKIEIVRGPGSAIYGADAYSGVINIITKTASEMHGLNGGVRIGSQNTKNAWIQYGTSFENNWDLAFNLEHFQRNSDKSRLVQRDAQTLFDELFLSSGSFAPTFLEDRMRATTYNLHLGNKHWKIGLDGYISRDVGVGAGAAQAIDPDGFDNVSQSLFTLSYQNDSTQNHWHYEGSFSYFQAKTRTEFQVFPPGAVLPVGNDGNIFTPHDGLGCLTVNIPGIGCVTHFPDGFLGNPGGLDAIPTFEASAHYKGWKNHQLRINTGMKIENFDGVETKNFGPGILDRNALNGSPNPIVVDGTLTDVTGTPYIYVLDTSRKLRYLSIQDIWEIKPNWTLTAGLRQDHYSDFGSTTNPRLALVWNASDTLITKVLYGEAFRAPSISELYARNNPVVLGNIHLQPETIKTTEVSFNQTFSNQLTAGLNFYYFEAKDMIEFQTNSQGLGSAQNNRNLRGQGFEAEVNWRLSEALKLRANYAHQETINGANSKQEEYVPQQQFYADLNWQPSPDWTISSQFKWVSDRARGPTDARPSVDDYHRMDLSLRRSNIRFGHGGKSWEFSATLKNVFDESDFDPSNGQIPGDYPMYGRRVFLEMRYGL